MAKLHAHKILIVGAGYVGSALAHKLQQKGHEIWAIKRHAGDAVPWQVIAIDVATTKINVIDFDYVFYLIAPNDGSVAAYEKVYNTALTNILCHLAEQQKKIRRLFFISSTAVYGQDHGEWVDEKSLTRPAAKTAQIILQAEQDVLSSTVPATVVRLSGIYGAGRTRFLEKIQRGEFSTRESKRHTNRIHLDDCVGCLVHLMQCESPETLYLASDCDPASYDEVVQWLASRLRVKSALSEPAPVAREVTDKRCSNQRLLQSGYQFKFPSYREGYEQILQEVGSSAQEWMIPPFNFTTALAQFC